MSERGVSTRISPLRKAMWWLQDYLYAAGWQVRGVLSRVQPGSFHQGHRRPVVIIPGVYENWQFMMPLIQCIHDAGHPVHVVTVLQRNKLEVPVAARMVVVVNGGRQPVDLPRCPTPSRGRRPARRR